ncbi:MAG TPA: hypothetical protein VEF89_33080 [Solirubrobacteraceae bacterium]|nr:hypothetical protein [Solirubrobacteraceae bacterium]
MSGSEAAPYEMLARSVERELELVGEGRFREVAQLQSERAALIATLPDVPPAGARAALQRAALMSKRVEIEILRYREALLLELAYVARVGRAARGYAPPRESRPHVRATA